MSCQVTVSEQPLRVVVNPVTNLVTVQSPGPQGPPGPGGSSGAPATDITYDNTTSGLTADDVQAAIDELAAAPGGGGTPGGSDTQIQYNDAGAFGGNAGFTFYEANPSLTIAGGTLTANHPLLNLSQTWNNSAVDFSAFKIDITDTGASANSRLIDVQLGGVPKFVVAREGYLYQQSTEQNYLGFTAFYFPPNVRVAIGTSWIKLANGVHLGFVGTDTTGATFDSSEFHLVRDEANALAQRATSSTAQSFRIYNTGTDLTNYERHATTWLSNVCYLRNENLGTGVARLMVPVTGGTTVSGLPSASTAGVGARAFVTDATATTFLSTVTGGGANKVPVVSDGTSWLIG